MKHQLYACQCGTVSHIPIDKKTLVGFNCIVIGKHPGASNDSAVILIQKPAWRLKPTDSSPIVLSGTYAYTRHKDSLSMRWPVDAIIFDLDGVVVDSGRDIASAVNYVLRSLHLKELDPKVIIGFIGGGAEPILRQSLGSSADALFSVALPLFLRRYSEHSTEETVLYPGMHSVLDVWARSGKRMGIATNKTQEVTARILKYLNVADYFELVIGPESVARRKPDPEALLIILRHLQAIPDRTLMIGDTWADIAAGKAAGTITCGATYGYGKVEELQEAGPEFLVDKPEDLLNHVA